MVADSRDDEVEAIRHLVELGYVDPDEVAARLAVLRNKLEPELRSALELFRQGRGQEAVPLLDYVTAEDPAWIVPRQLLAEVHYRAGSLREARVHLEWLEHHGVVTPKLASIRGAMALASRELAAAIEELEYAAYVEPELAGIQSLFGTALLRLGQKEAAEAAFECAIQQNPADAHALDGLAAVALQRGDFEATAHWALEALEYDMRLFRAHFHLGVALAQLDRTEAAIEAFTTCTRLDPFRSAPLYWLARITKEQIGDENLAANYREKAREVIRKRRDRTRK